METTLTNRIDELAYDIVMCLRCGMPVNVLHEYELLAMLDNGSLDLVNICPHLRELTEYFLDNGIEDAWNVGNALIGDLSA